MHLWAFMGADKLHKRAFSMEKRIEKLQTSEKPTVARKLTVKFKEREFSGDEVLVADSVSKAFGEKKLFSDLSLTVTGGERIALIGDNGTGKSTLIKMIMHDEAPDAGILYTGPAVRTGYLPQIVEFSDMSRTCLDTMLYDCRCQPQEARDRLAAFGFRGEDVLIPVSALSGGERSRLKLCMVMGGDINFLILDEPTNHLDISSREWMEDAISDYTQALLFVSHDRYFIEKFATRVWALENGALTDFRGSFSQYREYVARQQVFAKNEKTSVREKAPRRRPPNTAKRLERLEKDIEKAEERISELDALAEENGSDYQKLMEIGGEKTALEGELEELYRQWEELSD
jgi:ATPase subunit of ABC transporter with duplicated ATPase domains